MVSQLVEKVQHLLGFLLFLWYNKSGDENAELGAVRVGNAQDQHMLRHPAFLPSEVGRNAQGEALLAQQDISAAPFP